MKKTIVKKFTYFQIFEITFQTIKKIKGPIQVLASALKKHNYTNLVLKTNANNN